jgi:pyruvate kinase
MRQTKIVATIGPSSDTQATLPRLLRSGVDVVRLNFSHGSYTEMRRIIRIVRAYSKQSGREIAIMQDLQGPKVRVGEMKEGVVLKDRSEVVLTAKSLVGTDRLVPLQYKGLPSDVRSGDTILLNDGLIELRVLKTNRHAIRTQVIHGGPLGSHKGINVPSASLALPALTTKDKQDLAFGLKAGVDFVALSFVKTAAEIEDLRKRIQRAGSHAKIIAKVEKHEAVRNIDDIIAASDAVMVARGDLGVELDPTEVPLIQKQIIHKANTARKPVITATQMLESMIINSRPTRAEVSDVANAILDGSDAVMLSAETASGNFPFAAVEVMAQTAKNVEPFFASHELRANKPRDLTDAVSYAACNVANEADAALLIVPTESGRSARAVAQHRVYRPIVALTPNLQTARELALTWGVRASKTARPKTIDQMIASAKRYIRQRKLAKRGDDIVITSGPKPHESDETNTLQVVTL